MSTFTERTTIDASRHAVWAALAEQVVKFEPPTGITDSTILFKTADIAWVCPDLVDILTARIGPTHRAATRSCMATSRPGLNRSQSS